MTKFVLNEKEYAENAINNGIYDAEMIYRTLEIIAQYYYQIVGYRKIKITAHLIDWLSCNYPPYKRNKRTWERTAEKIASHTGGNKLLEIDGVWITQSEIDTIKAINKPAEQRLAFAMVCIAKLNNLRNRKNNGWLNLSERDLFAIANVNGGKKDRAMRIADMLDAGLIEIPLKSSKVNIRVTFLNDESPNALFVTDFRALGLQWVLLNKKGMVKIAVCQKCGIHYRDRDKSDYCPKCVDIIPIKPIATREVICIDCGKSFIVPARVTNKCRCADCQKLHRREQDRIRKHSASVNPVQTSKV